MKFFNSAQVSRHNTPISIIIDILILKEMFPLSQEETINYVTKEEYYSTVDEFLSISGVPFVCMLILYKRPASSNMTLKEAAGNLIYFAVIYRYK